MNISGKFVTLVLTTCTNRKRQAVAGALHASSLLKGDIAGLAADWAARLTAETIRFSAVDIYGGRGFREAVLAAKRLDARLMVISAGLGLIFAHQHVPAYACTIVVGAEDSIAARTVGDFTPTQWWAEIAEKSPFAQSLADAAEYDDGLIFAALSESYIAMIAEELLALPQDLRARLRLFTRAPLINIAAELHAIVMPYDDRLDGPDSPIRGTRGDFAGRALRHFAEHVIETEGKDRSAAQHGAQVEAALAEWRMPERFERMRHDDATLVDLLQEHWDSEKGSSSRLLRRFRDQLNIACEQGRFAALARQVRAERS